MLTADARVLVISVARIGDTLLATPVMRAVKAQCAAGQLTVLAHPKRLDALAHLPFIDRLAAIDKRRALVRGRMAALLQGRRSYDAALVFGRDAALVNYALRVADTVVAFDTPGLPTHGRLRRVAPQSGTHAVLERLRLAEALGFRSPDRRLAYRVLDAEQAAARTRVTARFTAGEGPLVALQMCSFPTKAHRDWPVGRFIELAERLAGRHPAVRFLVMGDRPARQAAAPFMARHGARTLLAAGETSLREAAALIGLADLYVGVDTGPTHLAGALGVPMVALYHCDYPGRNLMPLDHPACRIIEHPLTGGPCAGASMDVIDAEQVYRACEALLATAQTVIAPA
jgi:heptosyltransferase-3